MAYKIDSPNSVPVMPTPAAAGTPGWFSKGPPATIVDDDWCNMVQGELCNAAELVDNLDKTDHTQVARAIQAAVVGGAVSVGGATTEHVVAVAVSDTCGVFGELALVGASFDTTLNSDQSAALACAGVSHDSATDRSFSAASQDTVMTDATLCASLASESDTLEETNGSAVVAGNSNLIQYGTNHLIAAGDSNMVQVLVGGAIIASHESQIAAGSPMPARCAVLASRNCGVELGTANTTGDGGASNGGRSYVVAGGYHASGLVAPSWRLESQGGIMRSVSAHIVGGLDYAELIENGDGIPQKPGRLQTCRGARAHLAQPGDWMIGAVSVTPTIVGGEDGIAWAGRFVRDKWGAIAMEEVDATQSVDDLVALEVWKGRRQELTLDLRVARDGLATETDKDVKREYRKAVRELRAKLKSLKRPARVNVTERVRQMKLSPNWDPKREQVSRRSRPAEWTVVGMLGQMRIAIGPEVEVGDMLMPGKDGLGITAPREYVLDSMAACGARIRVMQIIEPYDDEAGEGVALCLIR